LSGCHCGGGGQGIEHVLVPWKGDHQWRHRRGAAGLIDRSRINNYQFTDLTYGNRTKTRESTTKQVTRGVPSWSKESSGWNGGDRALRKRRRGIVVRQGKRKEDPDTERAAHKRVQLNRPHLCPVGDCEKEALSSYPDNGWGGLKVRIEEEKGKG